MKTLKTCCIIWVLMATPLIGHAQFFKKLGERAQKAAERTVERRVEKESSKKTDQALDTILEGKKNKNTSKKQTSKGQSEAPEKGSQITANFDFEPGNIAFFEDTFTKGATGDFPAKWDTNGSGEIVLVDGKKWLRLANSSVFVPMTKETLPENYTIEFDFLTQGLDNKTSSQAFLKILLTDDANFKYGKNWSMVEISPCQFITSPGVVEKQVNGQRQLRNPIGKDYRNSIKGKSKVSIAVNKTRMRVWLNENKIIDVPRLVPEGITHFKLHTVYLRDARNQDELFIANFRMAKTGADNRSKLLTEGRLSTNAILFNTNSAKIKGGSEAILKEVAEAMRSVPEMKIRIVGHTDSDGSTDANLKLSQERAEAIRTALVSQHDIKTSRIETEGKGESEPVANNETAEGKAKNRRVEFIKL